MQTILEKEINCKKLKENYKDNIEEIEENINCLWGKKFLEQLALFLEKNFKGFTFSYSIFPEDRGRVLEIYINWYKRYINFHVYDTPYSRINEKGEFDIEYPCREIDDIKNDLDWSISVEKSSLIKRLIDRLLFKKNKDGEEKLIYLINSFIDKKMYCKEQ